MKKYQEIRNGDTAKLKLIIACGSLQEKYYEIGISHFLEHMNLIFAKREGFALYVCGDTDFECTQYYIECKNNYQEVNDSLRQLYSIMKGDLLSNDNMDIVREDILREIELQTTNPYFEQRNHLFKLFLQPELFKRMPVGNREVIQNISFEHVSGFQKERYIFSKAAICVSSRYEIFDTEHNNKFSVKKNSIKKTSKKLLWEIMNSIEEKDKLVQSIYFESMIDHSSINSYLRNELIKKYFFFIFDKYFKFDLQSKGLNLSEAVLYENVILDDTGIVTYKFKVDKYNKYIVKHVEKVIDIILNQKKIISDIMIRAQGELMEQLKEQDFFEKCKKDFLYGINTFKVFDEILVGSLSEIRVNEVHELACMYKK